MRIAAHTMALTHRHKDISAPAGGAQKAVSRNPCSSMRSLLLAQNAPVVNRSRGTVGRPPSRIALHCRSTICALVCALTSARSLSDKWRFLERSPIARYKDVGRRPASRRTKWLRRPNTTCRAQDLARRSPFASADCKWRAFSLRRLRCRDRLCRLDAGLKIGIFRRLACQTGALDSGLNEFLNMRGHEMQAAQFAGERLLQALAGYMIADPKAVEIKLEDTLLVGIARVAHPNMGIEPSGSLG